jgi:hypothetical protein
MSITRKPKPSAPVDVEALIRKGGTVPMRDRRSRATASELPVVVRIPSDLLDRIDALVATRPLRTPRHTWLLEAFLEKANREDHLRNIPQE